MIPIIATTSGTCCQCRLPFSVGSQVAFSTRTVRGHRDGAGRVWNKEVRRLRHWDCTPHVERERREFEIAQATRDIASFEELFAKDFGMSGEELAKAKAKMIDPLKRKIADLSALNA